MVYTVYLFFFVIHETNKQVKCVFNPQNTKLVHIHTIRKEQILKIVPAEKVAEIRVHANKTLDEYNTKAEELRSAYNDLMLSFDKETYG